MLHGTSRVEARDGKEKRRNSVRAGSRPLLSICSPKFFDVKNEEISRAWRIFPMGMKFGEMKIQPLKEMFGLFFFSPLSRLGDILRDLVGERGKGHYTIHAWELTRGDEIVVIFVSLFIT